MTIPGCPALEATACVAQKSCLAPTYRRAALVLLTAPVRSSDDPCFRELAFEVIERTQHERSILLTKAISGSVSCSWAIRTVQTRCV